jgi:hypothetical protein
MDGPPLRAPFTLLTPPLKARVRDMMVDARAQTARDLAFDFAQLSEHRLLRRRRVKPREISRCG